MKPPPTRQMPARGDSLSSFDDDNFIASAALSFGGISNSRVVAHKINDSFSNHKSAPPLPVPAMKQPHPPPSRDDRLSRLNKHKKASRGSPKKETMSNGNNEIYDQMGYLHDRNSSKDGELKMDDEKKINGHYETWGEEEKVASKMLSPSPPQSVVQNFGKQVWAPVSNSKSKAMRRSLTDMDNSKATFVSESKALRRSLDGARDSGYYDGDHAIDEAMEHVSEKTMTLDECLTDMGWKEPARSTPKSLPNENGHKSSRPSLRMSLVKSKSSPYHSDFSKLLEHDEDEISRATADDPSTVKSDGGRRRRRRRKKSSHSSSKKKGGKPVDLSPAMEKLKLAQAKLEGSSEGNGNDRRQTFQKKDLVNLLELSIRDLQQVQNADRDDDDDDESDEEESYKYATPSRRSEKSSSHRRHHSRGRSTGGRSRGSRDNKSTGQKSRGSKGSRHSRRRNKSSERKDSRGWEGGGFGTPNTNASSSGGHNGASSSLAAVPKEARRLLSCVRGSEALPRETIVSGVVRRLVSKIDREVNKETDGGACCVAVLSSSEQQDSSVCGGEGKSTIAALACVRGDVRTRYFHGIAWVSMEQRPLNLDFEKYSKALSDICRQIGVKPQRLSLNPVVRTPEEDEIVFNIRMKGHMKEAFFRMGKLLTSLQRKKGSRREDGHTTVLIVLDDVADQSDIEWFQFRRGGGGGETNGNIKGEQINDLFVTSRLSQIEGAISLTVPPLETAEAIRLLLTESDLPSNHPMANNRVARGLVKDCLRHPLTIKFAGRWLSLKRVTSGGQKGIDEILREVSDAVVEFGRGSGNENGNNVDVLYTLLNRAMSPLVKGKETKIVRLCFAALIDVFYDETCSASVPLEIASDFFLKVVENEKDFLSKEDAFFQNNGRQSSKLVPEILGALGIFNITKHTTPVEGSVENESSIQIDHDLIRQFSNYIRNDESMHHLVKNAEKCWNEAYVQSYFQQKAKYLWDDIQPDRSRKYGLVKMPIHMIRAEMFHDVEILLLNESFIRGRFWSLGWTEGTRAHVNDAEVFCKRLQESPANNNEECFSKLVNICKQIEAVLMEEVARESGGPNGRCSTLEAGRCLHEISLSLAKFRVWDEASRFCHSCVQLAESNLGPSELVASLLYNSSVMHTEADEFDQAEKIIEDCLEMRLKTCGTESILYVRALCQLGDILSLSSDYPAAESCFKKSIDILKIMPARYHLDFGIALYKLGRNQHRRGGYLDEALHCYRESLEFEKDELGPKHIFVSSIFLHMGDIWLDKEDTEQANNAFKEALDALSGVDSTTLEWKIMSAVVQGKAFGALGQCDKCIEKYEDALAFLKKFTPTNRRKISQICSLLGTEYEKSGNYHAAEKVFEESVSTMKAAYGPNHLDIAETLVNLSGVKSAIGWGKGTPNSKHLAEATACLEESVYIQKSKLGESEECAITLTILGAHLKSTGAYKKSELAYNDAIRILQSLNGDQDLSLADALLGIADLMTAMSKYSEAMDYYSSCQEIQESVFGETHDDIASTLYAIGLMKHEQGLCSTALIFFAKSLVMRVELHGEAHPAVGDVYDMMGFVEAKNGELNAALRRLNDALKVRKALGDHVKEADTLNNIGNLHRERNEYQLAMQRYQECLNIRTSEIGRNDERVADVLMALGNVRSDMGNHEDALSHYREALQILISTKGPYDRSVASTFQKAGMVQFRAGNLGSGLSFLQKSVELYRECGGEYKSELINPLFIIGNILNTLGKEEEAWNVWVDAFETSKMVGAKKNPQVHRFLKELLLPPTSQDA